jgi:hypothetical protein
MLKTWNWHQGRRGEYLQTGLWASYGWGLMDFGGTTRNVAPLLKLFNSAIVAPDAIGWRKGQVAFQFKTKAKHMAWGGGSANDTPKVAARTEEGVDRRCWEQHLQFQVATGIPVVLSILTINPAELLAATLAELGEPRFSSAPGQDLVNWDVRRFHRICRLDPAQLRCYFFTPDGIRREAPVDAPPMAEMQRWLKRLAPAQEALPALAADVLANTERDWLAA